MRSPDRWRVVEYMIDEEDLNTKPRQGWLNTWHIRSLKGKLLACELRETISDLYSECWVVLSLRPRLIEEQVFWGQNQWESTDSYIQLNNMVTQRASLLKAKNS